MKPTLISKVIRNGLLAGASLALLGMPAYAGTLVVRNVRGYTPSPTGMQSFSTLVVVDGRVHQLLGPAENIVAERNAVVIDGRGKTLLPGLIDAHGHVLNFGRERVQVNLRGSNSIAEAQKRIRLFGANNSQDAWVLGRGWNQVLWTAKKFPTAGDLDAAIPDRPALMWRVDGHAIWVNSRALKLAGINATTQSPSGGQIIRDSSGNATGVFVDAANDLILKHLPQSTSSDDKRALRAAMIDLVSQGLTGVHDAGIDLNQYRLYRELGAARELPLRIYAMLADSEAARATLRAGPKPPEFEDRLQMRAIKAWIDGALGSRGAAMLADYSDRPSLRGTFLYTREQLHSLTQLAAGSGWQVNVHAIGDAGNRSVLDIFERAMTAEQRRTLRPRIEHAQVVALSDIARFQQLDVIASLQPTHATSDMNMAEERVGHVRIQGAYAWRKLLSTGARLAGGSDFPVELANPFDGLYAAITRQDAKGNPPGGWYGEGRLTREEALRLFTIDAAYAGHQEDSTGSLAPGKWADFILIDRDYFAVASSEIQKIRVTATYVAGEKVWSASEGD
ncbi:MAG: amidohydrolase [Candidatus Obscuribacterales bacterium]|nr:amidohydrolase [Steroidobacteraceae bacterium]